MIKTKSLYSNSRPKKVGNNIISKNYKKTQKNEQLFNFNANFNTDFLGGKSRNSGRRTD